MGRLLAALAVLAVGVGAVLGADPREPVAATERQVLVELFTSQGCNLCPEAEELLGKLAALHRRAVVIAYHVDYFNDPWQDPYSDARHSRRQREYDQVYPKPKPPEYGLYYTPMLMIDGAWSVNGRDRTAADATIRQALRRSPPVALRAWWSPRETSAAAELQVRVAARFSLAEGRRTLIGAVLRDDALTNRVESGENAGRTLVARFPARQAQFEEVTLDGRAERSLRFVVSPDPAWGTNRLRVAVFAQDVQSGLVHQALDLPWSPGGEPPVVAPR